MMHRLDWSAELPAENLAGDEALLELVERMPSQSILRFWESSTWVVVLGISDSVEREVDMAECQEARIPVLRRCTGGGAVLLGPGCLNYALVTASTPGGPFSTISHTNRHVMRTHAEALRTATGLPIEVCGVSDLVCAGRKFSGNAQRRQRAALLFHGTFLLSTDLALMERCLRMPARRPEYRQERGHGAFVGCLEAAMETVKASIAGAWGAVMPFEGPPIERSRELARTKYEQAGWTGRT
jgi:lipoate---protein ligase